MPIFFRIRSLGVCVMAVAIGVCIAHGQKEKTRAGPQDFTKLQIYFDMFYGLDDYFGDARDLGYADGIIPSVPVVEIVVPDPPPHEPEPPDDPPCPPPV